jgi:hypothetical protein
MVHEGHGFVEASEKDISPRAALAMTETESVFPSQRVVDMYQRKKRSERSRQQPKVRDAR